MPKGRPKSGERPAPRRTDGDARRLALLALSDVVAGGAFSGLALSKRLRESTLSPEDKRLATGIFYAALENRLRIDYVLAQFVAHMPEQIVREILHIAAAQLLFLTRIPDHAAVDEAVKQIKSFGRESYAPLVNGTLRNLIRARDAGQIEYPDRAANPVRYLSVLHSMSEPVMKRLVEAHGLEEAERIVSFRPDERWESVRANGMRMDEAAFEAYLSGRGWQHRRGAVPGSWQVMKAGDLPSDPDYRKGLFSVQGASSMLAARAVAAGPGMRILDACAAPGGKSMLMAEMMQDTGRIYAYDKHPHRVELIKAAAARLRLYNIRPAIWDASVLRAEHERTMDAVLLDAPCSGLGVIANKPDIKYRLRDEEIDEMIRVQRQLLDTCCRYVKPGGGLVYATCSVLPEENEHQARAFLAAHEEFEPDPANDWLPEALRERFSQGMIQFFAHLDEGMDGFFIARMRRKDDWS